MKINTGQVTANILNTAATQKDVKIFTATVTSGTATIGTVGAGKRWTIIRTELILSCSTAATSTAKLTMAGVDSQFCTILGTTNGVTGQSNLMGSYTEPIKKLAATETLTYTCPNNSTLAYNIAYIEEDV